MSFINNILTSSGVSRNKKFLFFLTGVVLFLNACDNPEIYNLNAGNKNDRFPSRTVDTCTVTLQTIREDSFFSYAFARNLLGSYTDGIIGSTTASVYTNLQLPLTDSGFGTNPVLDSVTLRLKYYGAGQYFGSPAIPQTIHVFEMTEKIYRDTVYYTSHNFKYNPVEIGRFHGSMNPTDTGVLIIRLSSTFGNKILHATLKQLSDPDSFTELVKGIALIPEKSNYLGALVYFNLTTQSAVNVYFSGGKSLSFPISSGSQKINTFKNDYSAGLVNQQLIKPGTDYDPVYLSPTAGLKVKVRMPYLKNLLDSGLIALTRADIVFTPDENSPYLSYLPKKLLLFRGDSTNKNYNFADRFESYYDGVYNKEKNEYRFGITRYIQYLITQYNIDPGFKNNFGFNLVIPNDNYNITSLGIAFLATGTPVVIRNKDRNGMPAARLELSFVRVNKTR